VTSEGRLTVPERIPATSIVIESERQAPGTRMSRSQTQNALRLDGHRPCRRSAIVPLLTLGVSAVLLVAGCRAPRYDWQTTAWNDTACMDRISRAIDEPDVEIMPSVLTVEPVTLRDKSKLATLSYRDVSLTETIRIALQNSTVVRDLGGVLLRNPDVLATQYMAALRETDPRYGMEAALSAFDAQLAATSYFKNNDQTFNNPFFAGGTNTLRQDLHDYSVELSKRTVTGSRLALRSVSNYDANNAPSNTFRSAWDTYVEGEIRQPLLQGGGIEFNRIAGPGATPGVNNGLLIARANNDISQTDFEIAVRDYVSNVSNAYWDLYFAYRDLDARIHAMNRSLEAWNRLQAKAENDLESSARVALAREQYYRFKSEVDDALSGRLVQGTQNRNGSTGGTVRGTSGVQVAERRLRLLIGLPINEESLLRPVEEPLQADVIFHWDSIVQEALTRRPELRRQQINIQKRHLEVLAARNYLNPRLDTVGRYRFRGFGDNLLEDGDEPSAVSNLTDGDLQEWYIGLEYTVPLGYRKGHLAVSNAELQLTRERALLQEQEREVIHDLSNAVSDSARAYEAVENALNRLIAATEVLTAYETQEQNDLDVDIDRLLDAQRRVVEAEIRYYQARTEYAVAVKNVHIEKGSLMAYCDLTVFDGESPVIREQVEVAGEAGNTTADADAASPVEFQPSAAFTDEPGSKIVVTEVNFSADAAGSELPGSKLPGDEELKLPADSAMEAETDADASEEFSHDVLSSGAERDWLADPMHELVVE
jgi:outer membrane protein TolC